MSRGHPDFGQSAPTSFVSPVADLGELAAMLGSPVVFDRRGKIIFIDDFSNGLNRFTQTPTASVTIADDTGLWFSNGHSCSIVSSAGNNQTGTIQVNVGDLANTKIGLALMVRNVNGAGTANIAVYKYDGTNQHQAIIQLDYVNDRVLYQDSAGVMQSIYDPSVGLFNASVWNYVKLVFNLTDNTFDRLRIDNQELDIKGVASRQSVAAVSIRTRMFITRFCEDGGEGANKFYIDNVVMSVDED